MCSCITAVSLLPFCASAAILLKKTPSPHISNGYNKMDQLDPNRQERWHGKQPDYYDEDPFNNIPGVPGEDYPAFFTIPRTKFSCRGRIPGFYADEEAGCQVWHYCRIDGGSDSFLCPNGTVYNQSNRVCEWWFNVLCDNVEAAFGVNEDLYITPIPNKRLKGPYSHQRQVPDHDYSYI